MKIMVKAPLHAERILMGPGPCNPYPEVVEAFGRPLLGHLDPDFIDLWTRRTNGSARSSGPRTS